MARPASSNPTEGDPNAPDPIDRLDACANFQLSIYPGGVGIPEKVPTNAPPAFFVVANDDTSHVISVLLLANKYYEARRPLEVHIYSHGGHGFSISPKSKFHSVNTWSDRMTDWLKENHILEPPTPEVSK